MTTVHLVYPHGDRISCPDAIGRRVGAHLRSLGYTVRHYDWDDSGVINPGPDDVLLGHPHPRPWTIFRRSMRHSGWKRVVVMCPYQTGDMWLTAWLDRVLPGCDHYLAITGRYWFERIQASPCAHWRPRMEHLDLAVDGTDFQPLKTSFNPPGRRRLLYIGHTGLCKNTEYLRSIAQALPDTAFAWFGRGRDLSPITALGTADFRDPTARARIAEYDILINVSRADANPTTILEAMSWGLIPLCTPHSGYEQQHAIVNLPLGDVTGAVAVIQRLQAEPEERLLAMQAENRAALAAHYHWPRFCAQVATAVADRSPRLPLDPCPLRRRIGLRVAELTAPDCPYPPIPWLRRGAKWLRDRRLLPI